MVQSEVINLFDLSPEEVPEELSCGTYFDLDEHPFEHKELITGSKSVIDVLERLHAYIEDWLSQRVMDLRPGTASWSPEELKHYLETGGQPPVRHSGRYKVVIEEGADLIPDNIMGSPSEEDQHTIYVARGAKVLGADFYTDTGDIFIGEKTIVEPGVGIHGPAIIGAGNILRKGTYIREDVIIGDECIIRGELKGSVVMNSCDYPHPSYLGDSLCGYRTHFGNQVTAANFGLFNIVEPQKVRVKIDDRTYNTGRQKVGIVMGDFSQVGCNCAADPGVFLRPWTLVYTLVRLRSGIYGPRHVIKHKPENVDGLIEKTPLRR